MTDTTYTPSVHPAQAQDELEYPYEDAHESLEVYCDPYGRPAARLLDSLAHYGHKIHNPLMALPPRLRQIYPVMTQFCENKMSPTDIWRLFEFSPPVSMKGRRLLSSINLLSHDLPELSKLLKSLGSFEQLVVLHHLDQDQWAIFLVLLPTRNFEGYLIGDTQVHKLSGLQNKLGVALGQAHGVKFMYRQRLCIPQSFKVNPLLMAYILANFLHQHGRYLELTLEQIQAKQCLIMTPFIKLHDRWLGQLDCERINETTHFFVTSEFFDDRLEYVTNMGWSIVDVLGDGNCGYYSLILGLENNNNYTFSPLKYPPSKAVWQSKVVELRKHLQKQSRLLLRAEYPPGRRDQAFWRFSDVFGLPNEDFDALSNVFVDESLSDEDYFNQSFIDNKAHHTDINWIPHVFSFTFGMRVVVYIRERQKNTRFRWMTLTFDFDRDRENRVVHSEFLDRMSDEDLKRRPTVELLFLSGYNVDQHVLFLRRTICHGVPSTRIRPSASLRKCVARNPENKKNQLTKHQLRTSLPKKVTKVRLRALLGQKVANVPLQYSPRPTTGKVPPVRTIGKVLPAKSTTMRTNAKEYRLKMNSVKDALTELYLEQTSHNVSGKKLAVKLLYKSSTKEFHKRDWDDISGKYKTKTEIVEDISEYHDDLVKAAVTYPGIWMFPSPGDPGVGTAPDELKTTIRTIYQQHEKGYCLTYSMASALFYCGFKEQAGWLAQQAPFFSAMDG